MYEKEAEKYVKTFTDRSHIWSNDKLMQLQLGNAFKDGAEFGYNKAMKEWRDCFMSCSSPYCADKFRDIQCGGMLGNMTKEVRDGSVE